MSFAIFSIYLLSLVSAFLLRNTAAAGAAVLEGAADALRFAAELAGPLCLWSAVTELLERGGAADALARFLRVPLGALFPRGFCDQDTRAALTENLSANLLGLGNAATPAGIRAAKGLSRLAAEKELHLLVVVNTASIQLLPTTAASVRASVGSAAPFDITGAVWVSSALSLLAGLAAIRLLDGGKA